MNKTNSLTRRGFVEKISTLTIGGLIGSRFASFGANAAPVAASEPHISFPTVPRDRISVASYPFRAYIVSPKNRDRDKNVPGMTLLEFPAHVVAKFNVHNVEPLGDHFDLLEPAYLAKFREAMEKAGVHAVNIPVGASRSFYDADPANRDVAVAHAKQWVDAAVQIGSPGIRTHVRSAKNSKPNVDRAAESLRKVADHAAEKNVVITLENDDLVSEDAFFIVKTVEAVNNPYLRALPDFANSMLTGDADFNYRALTAMFQHAYNICHIKDGEAGEHGKQFNIDVKKSFDILKASGYRGYCSMEYDAPGDPYPPTTKLIEQTLTYLA